ncbi:MAG: alpha-amylase family glycosyl hydrolase [Bacteroidota bacterium]
MKSFGILFFLLAATVAIVWLSSCQKTTTPSTSTFDKPRVPDWHKNATIYEVNLRHYTQEGTFRSFETELPRLKAMGIDILWFMPINPISIKNRKGELGSPYAVADYKDVNPDYGTIDDFKHILAAIHEQGMYCIIDWVPNHTGWDNPWITEHPEWYTQDADGNIIDPIDYNTGKSWGWTDVADLNYDVPEMRKAMIEAMKFWITEVGIDGFRVDVAHGVPVDFWAECSDALYAEKAVFMLAEAEVPAIRNNGAFVMDYGWEMHHLLNEIAASQGANREKGSKLVQGNLVEGESEEAEKKNALDIDAMLAKKAKAYQSGYFMQFTSNHDENSWSGTEFQRMGDGHKAFAVLTATFDGMPLVYTGQESAMDKQLEFFVKDTIEWGDYSYADFYRRLFELKHRNQALWNGEHGGALVKVPTGNDENIYAFIREKNGDKVMVMINLSAASQNAQLKNDQVNGEYKEIFTEQNVKLIEGQEMELGPWEYRVLEGR